jgi:hypothetical protein
MSKRHVDELSNKIDWIGPTSHYHWIGTTSHYLSLESWKNNEMSSESHDISVCLTPSLLVKWDNGKGLVFNCEVIKIFSVQVSILIIARYVCTYVGYYLNTWPSSFRFSLPKLCTYPHTLHILGYRVARFLMVQHTKTGTNIPNNHTYNIPNGHKIYQMAVNRPNGYKIDQQLPLHDPPKFTQIVIFWFEICHLATLLGSCIQRHLLLHTYYVLILYLPRYIH